MLRLHGVFLTLMALTLAWNLTAARRGEERAARGVWLDGLILALMAGLAAVLLLDRTGPDQASLLGRPWVAAAFPLIFLLTAVQNTLVIVSRGARLTDIPLVLFNVGIGATVTVTAMSLHGWALGYPEARLLYEGSIVQGLLGTRLAHVWTLSWHLPFLLRRRPVMTVPGMVVALVPVAVAGLAVLLLVALAGAAGQVVAAFDVEPRATDLRADLAVGVTRAADIPLGSLPAPPGELTAWRLPADHDGEGLPAPSAGRPLVLELSFPRDWYSAPPDDETRDRVMLEGAVRLAASLRPAVLLPFPEPDGTGTLHFGADVTPDRWRRLYEQTADGIRAASPDTRLAVRLAGTGLRSERIMEALLAPPAVVDVAGPRLEPGGLSPGQGDLVDEALQAWHRWTDGLTDPPELWVLAAGLSPLAFGERAQARFVEGVLARADADPDLRAVLLIGWRDLGHTQGLLRPDGAPRPALVGLERLLVSRRAGASR